MLNLRSYRENAKASKNNVAKWAEILKQFDSYQALVKHYKNYTKEKYGVRLPHSSALRKASCHWRNKKEYFNFDPNYPDVVVVKIGKKWAIYTHTYGTKVSSGIEVLGQKYWCVDFSQPTYGEDIKAYEAAAKAKIERIIRKG